MKSELPFRRLTKAKEKRSKWIETWICTEMWTEIMGTFHF